MEQRFIKAAVKPLIQIVLACKLDDILPRVVVSSEDDGNYGSIGNDYS